MCGRPLIFPSLAPGRMKWQWVSTSLCWCPLCPPAHLPVSSGSGLTWAGIGEVHPSLFVWATWKFHVLKQWWSERNPRDTSGRGTRWSGVGSEDGEEGFFHINRRWTNFTLHETYSKTAPPSYSVWLLLALALDGSGQLNHLHVCIFLWRNTYRSNLRTFSH